MPWLSLLSLVAVTALISWAGTGLLVKILTKRGIIDRPNARSSHRQPRPRGGGIAVCAAVLLGGLGAGGLGLGLPPGAFYVLVGATILAVVSWFDDLRGLSVALRLPFQIAAVALGLVGLQGQGAYFQGFLPPALDLGLAALLWLWFLNLFNFMDGIDGISGAQSISLGLGLALLAVLLDELSDSLSLALILAAAAAGFLVWNWPPSRIFLGDVGSIPLGYLFAWLLLAAAAAGAWAPAVILPLYYLADASFTLARRAFRGVRLWQAHKEHFYQRAVQNGMSHAAVVTWITLCNLALIGLSLLASGGMPGLALFAACLVVAATLFRLSSTPKVTS